MLAECAFKAERTLFHSRMEIWSVRVNARIGSEFLFFIRVFSTFSGKRAEGRRLLISRLTNEIILCKAPGWAKFEKGRDLFISEKRPQNMQRISHNFNVKIVVAGMMTIGISFSEFSHI